MTARLDISTCPDGYVIGWWDEEDGIEGDLCLGEKGSAEEEEDDHLYITKRLPDVCPPDYLVDGRFCWELKSDAQKALRAANALLREYEKGKPWPEWALKAQAEGWKPPKGWRP